MDLLARPAGIKSPPMSALPCTRWHGPPRLRLRNILFDHGICNKGHQLPEAVRTEAGGLPGLHFVAQDVFVRRIGDRLRVCACVSLDRLPLWLG